MSVAALWKRELSPKSSCLVVQDPQTKYDRFSKRPTICKSVSVGQPQEWQPHRYRNFFEHADAFTSVDERYILRGRNNHSALGHVSAHVATRSELTVHDHELAEAELNIASPWWHINHKDIKVLAVRRPIDIEQQLVELSTSGTKPVTVGEPVEQLS